MEYMNHFLTISGALPVGGVWASMSAMPNGIFTANVQEAARTQGKKLISSWRAGEVPPDVDVLRKNFRERMQGLVDYRKEEWPYEYKYWKEKTAV